MEHRYITIFCTDCGYSHEVRLHCGDRLCEECKEQNYYRLLNKYLPVVKNARFLSQLTLTIKHFAELDSDRIKFLLSCFRAFRNHPEIVNKLNGGLAVIECKHVSDQKGWNMHMHVLLDSVFLDQKRISSIWSEITGGSFIVDIRREEQSTHAVYHLLKYLQKNPVIWSERGDDAIEALCEDYRWAFKGSRHVISFGSFYSALPEEKEPYRIVCPVCGSVQWMTEFEMEAVMFRWRRRSYAPG
jgi:hypothetical protein